MYSKLLKVSVAWLLVAVAGCAALGSQAQADRSWVQPARVVNDPEYGRPYRIETVLIRSGDHEIASTLLVPLTDQPPPVVITVSGAGHGLVVPEAPVYRRLVARGYAVLALGKKGVGASGGDWRRESFDDRARNVVAAMDWAATRTDIDGSRVALHGHSQGGYVIPLVASDPRVQALVLAAGPSRNVRDQIYDHTLATAIFMGVSPLDAQRKAERTTRWLDVLVRACPVVRFHYLCGVYHYDPAPALAAVRKPVLALFNQNDEMVPPDTNIGPMAALLADNPHAQIRLLADADHSHIINPSGLQARSYGLVGPRAVFPHAREGDPEHDRLAAMHSNRLPYAEGYVDAIEAFVTRHMDAATPAALPVQVQQRLTASAP